VPSSTSALQFVPLIKVGPHVSRSVVTAHGGVLPDLKIHFYEPSDITAAYGVDAVHGAGTTGAGQTIVIVNSYGSPAALQDLQQFSADFGLPAPNLQIYHPCGEPTFNNAMHSEPAGWAFETSFQFC